MIRTLSILLFCLLTAIPLHAQELNATVTVDRTQVAGTSTDWLRTMEEDIRRYLNGTRWTDHTFEERERVDVTVQVILVAADNNYNVSANLVIRSQRPIYNTLQSTPLFLFSDEGWEFSYPPGRTLVHDELRFDELTTVLDFYAYMVLGWDFDSFSPQGGTPYFNEARNLVSLALASPSSGPGWSRTSPRRNRSQLAENLANPAFDTFREAIYRYHREGLDRFLDAPEEAREEILGALEMISQNRQNTTQNLLFDTFFSAKHREIAAIFRDAPLNVRREAYDLLSNIDPSHLSAYEALRQ